MLLPIIRKKIKATAESFTPISKWIGTCIRYLWIVHLFYKTISSKFVSRHDRSVFQWGACLFSFFYEYFCGISGNFYRKIILIYSVFHLQVSLVERIKFLKKTFSANNSEKPRCLEKPRCVLKMLSLIKPSNGFRFMPICLKCGAQIPSFMNFAVPNDIISNETPCMSLCFYVCYFLGAFVPLSPTKWCD